jgi:hypothetical protein
MFKYSFDNREMIIRSIKYIIMGLMVALGSLFIPEKKIHISEVVIISMVASITFALLDMYSPSVSIVMK